MDILDLHTRVTGARLSASLAADLNLAICRGSLEQPRDTLARIRPSLLDESICSANHF